jgi:ribonuclease E
MRKLWGNLFGGVNSPSTSVELSRESAPRPMEIARAEPREPRPQAARERRPREDRARRGGQRGRRPERPERTARPVADATVASNRPEATEVAALQQAADTAPDQTAIETTGSDQANAATASPRPRRNRGRRGGRRRRRPANPGDGTVAPTEGTTEATTDHQSASNPSPADPSPANPSPAAIATPAAAKSYELGDKPDVDDLRRVRPAPAPAEDRQPQQAAMTYADTTDRHERKDVDGNTDQSGHTPSTDRHQTEEKTRQDS